MSTATTTRTIDQVAPGDTLPPLTYDVSATTVILGAGAIAQEEETDGQSDEDQADGQNGQNGVVQGVALAAISDSISLTVSGCGSPAACRIPGTPTPFARSSGVRSLASFACRSAPCSARNFTIGVRPRCAAPCSAV